MKNLILALLLVALPACGGPYFEYRADERYPQPAPIEPGWVHVVPAGTTLDIPPREVGVIVFDSTGLSPEDAGKKLRDLAGARGCDVLLLPEPGHHAAKCYATSSHPSISRRY